jgi:hypothetical protein
VRKRVLERLGRWEEAREEGEEEMSVDGMGRVSDRPAACSLLASHLSPVG